MTSQRSVLTSRVALLGLAALGFPATANAAKIVLTPLLVDATVNAKQRLGVHQLIASELEFAPELEAVVDLDAAPATLDDTCLSNPRCLGQIAMSNGGDVVMTGRLSAAGTNYTLDLLYFDGLKVARRKAYTVPQDPTELANAITPIVRELLTGASPDSGKPAPTASGFDPDDELAVAGGVAGGVAMADLLDEEPPPPPPAPAARKPAPAPAPAGADARRLAAAGAATGMVTAPPPVAPPPPAPSEEDLAKMISFGGSVNDISAEEIDSMIKFGAPPGVAAAPAPAPMPAPMPPPPAPARPVPRGVADPELAAEEAELASLDGEGSGGITDLDGEEDPPKAERVATPQPTRSTGTAPRPQPKDDGMSHRVQVTGRGGYSRYYTFDFVTGGGEIGVNAYNGLHFVAGLEAYAVKRVLPPELQIQTGLYSEWNYIFPLNLGVLYKFDLGIAQPYAGADAIFVQYYRDEIGADWAAGGRFRTGIDLMFIPNFGMNLNLAAGGWFGKNWGLIEQGVGAAGFLPQVSGGPVVAF